MDRPTTPLPAYEKYEAAVARLNEARTRVEVAAIERDLEAMEREIEPYTEWVVKEIEEVCQSDAAAAKRYGAVLEELQQTDLNDLLILELLEGLLVKLRAEKVLAGLDARFGKGTSS